METKKGYGVNGTKKRLSIIAEEVTMLTFHLLKAMRTLEDNGIEESLETINKLVGDLSEHTTVLRGKYGISNGKVSRKS